MSVNMEGRPVKLRVLGAEPVRILVAVLLAFVLAQLLLAGLFAWRGVVSEAMLTPKQLMPYQGTGGTVSDKKARFHADAQGQLIVVTPDLKGHFNTRDYAAIRVLGKGMPLKNASAILILPDRKKLPLKQSPGSKPGALRFSIPATPVAPLHGLALLFEGVPGTTPVVIDSVRFEPRHPVPLLRAWKALWRNWLAPEGWQLYSVNYIKGGKVEDLRSSPAVAGLLWFVLAMLIWWGGRGRPRKVRPGVAIAVMGLLIWTVVDFRWQVDQWRSLQRWLDDSPPADLAASGYVTSLAQIDSLAKQIRSRLPEDIRRLLIVSPDALIRSRLRYAMLPINSLPVPALHRYMCKGFNPGDYLLLISTGDDYHFDPVTGQLGCHGLRIDVQRITGGNGVELYRYLQKADGRSAP